MKLRLKQCHHAARRRAFDSDGGQVPWDNVSYGNVWLQEKPTNESVGRGQQAICLDDEVLRLRKRHRSLQLCDGVGVFFSPFSFEVLRGSQQTIENPASMGCEQQRQESQTGTRDFARSNHVRRTLQESETVEANCGSPCQSGQRPANTSVRELARDTLHEREFSRLVANVFSLARALGRCPFHRGSPECKGPILGFCVPCCKTPFLRDRP
jgi:hypothetical protein